MDAEDSVVAAEAEEVDEVLHVVVEDSVADEEVVVGDEVAAVVSEVDEEEGVVVVEAVEDDGKRLTIKKVECYFKDKIKNILFFTNMKVFLL